MLSLKENYGLIFLLLILMTITEIKSGGHKQCYWNSECPYSYFATKTPYDTVRGDIRDYVDPPNCQAINLWSMIRHGNRYPGDGVTKDIKDLEKKIKGEIIESFKNGKSQLCAQDIENLREWRLSEEVASHPSGLTAVGYEELFGIAKRIREKYSHLLTSTDDIYVRPTKKVRSVDSAKAFVDGISAHTDLKLKYHNSWDIDNVAAPFENCTRFHHNLIHNPVFNTETQKFFETEEALGVLRAVQQRLGIPTELSVSDIWTLYEICRYDRSWAANLKSPWCALFSNDDLKILDYRDDVKRYYKNGYAVWFNPRLGAQSLKDLYEKFAAATRGEGKKIVAYMGHATTVEMMFTALDMFKDAEPITGSKINLERLWRNTFINPMASNFIAVLYDCKDSGSQYKMQLLHNEKLSGICPESGCTWDQFTEKFSGFLNVSLDFCSLEYPEPTLNFVNLN